MNVKDKPPDNYLKCIKVPLKHVLKHQNVNLIKINETVIKAHKIVIHTLQFMKLYLLDHYNKKKILPKIDKVFINCCMKILCNENAGGRPPKEEIVKLKKKLTTFYNKYYKSLTVKEDLDYTYMNTILDYLTIDILTMYENNIKQHYVEYVERYVNVVWQKKFMIEKIRKVKKTKKDRESTIKQLCKQLRRIKNDLLNVENDELKSNTYYHKWIKEQKKLIVPIKNEFKKDSLYYDLQCFPQDYLPCMVYMMKHIEQLEFSVNNVFPMRSNITPKHIRLDTTTIIHLLITKKQGNKSNYLFKGNLKRFEDKIWKFFFNTEKQCFKKKHYKFHHMIETDGISCSILMLRNDLVGKRVKMNKIPKKEEYIDELKSYSKFKDKKIVAIDPNMGDLLYCVNGDTRERNFFRYTQNQRRKETKQKKYQKIILEYKKEKIKGKTVIEWETELSKYNRKSLTMKEFKKYVKNKNKINKILFTFYEKCIFRKLKLNGYLNRLKSEQWMINNFTKIFGKPKETIVCIGDWEQKKHRKFKEPTKGKKFRTLLRKNSFQTYLIDEFRTSCRCSNCLGGECSKFRKCRNPKPNKNDSILRHGVLVCKTCSALWNRDENSARNIYRIAYNAIHKKERPKYLSRSKVVSGTTSVDKLQCHSVQTEAT